MSNNTSEDGSKISINMSTKHKENKYTCFSYVVLTRNHRDISISIRKTSVFALLMLRGYVYAYAYAYALVKISLKGQDLIS